MPPRRNEEIQENLSAQNRQQQQQQQSGNEEEEEEDIISCLPDALLHHILSFVDMKLVVQTSVLSKRWRNVWTSLGCLTFDVEQFYSPTMTRSVVRFTDFVDQVLILRDNSTIDVFSFRYHYPDSLIDILLRLHAWITAFIRRRVPQIYLRLYGNVVIPLPSCLFASDSLIALALAFDGNKGPTTVPLPESMDLPKLKFLLLRSVVFYDEKRTNELFFSCPELERLYLADVELQVNVDIFSNTLVGLYVNNYTKDYTHFHWIDRKFTLHAPNLKVLVCEDFMFRDYNLENLNSLSRADVNMKVERFIERYGVQLDPLTERKQLYGQRMMRFLRALHKVENLKLSAWFLEVISGSPDLLDCQPIQFRSLKYLKLKTWLSRDNIRAITYLLKISPILESLSLEISKIKLGSSNIGENPEAWFICLLDKLVLVEIQGAEGCVNELLFLEMLLKNAKVLKKLVVYFSKEDSSDKEERMMKFTENLSTFQKASSDIEILFF